MSFQPDSADPQTPSDEFGGSDSAAKAPAAQSFKILLVDPEALVRYAVGGLLSKIPGCEVAAQVSDPDSAFRALKADE